MNSLSFLDSGQAQFPPPELALTEPNGLLAIGGDLSVARLSQAYYQGIFPWFNEDDPILWWSPDPRAVFVPGNMHISHSLLKFIKRMSWRFSINQAFSEVIRECAAPRAKQQGTWITPYVQQAYLAMHLQGRAHSLEVWNGEELVGGLYGVAVGQVFCGESMFHRQTNASKAAMAMLCQYLQAQHFRLIDAQVMNPHLQSIGARALMRKEFLALLHQFRDGAVNPECWHRREVFLELN
ncbi:MAG: leucyl/phenylalanyl-tRNA--protein transferase [Shewanella sp.]|nr:leucyl/phenylalanyl-tRNA--protein transferase [Shewanella sp.]MCF1430654.1 leucyl/phenylalanyl-tRNA--protein transferase [Shewanella sp.]MCF1439110.1 leucyl/phenylalanyl-tRNA--protein transferase [Shewanella sp.]MCF1456963.1 leucyl/phenylalanyl-tRNA--protein transferase [Shewanella sp.]